MIVFERLGEGSGGWNERLSGYLDRTIFQTSEWVSFVARTQHAEPVLALLRDREQILGCFTGLVTKKVGFRILGSPFPGWTTAYMGLCLADGVSRRAAVEALTRFAFEELQCAHLEFMDRNLTVDDLGGLGFQHRMYEGFEVDLTQSENQLLGNMTSACRRCIRKADKTGVVIEEVDDVTFADDYYAQLQDVFAKQSLVPSYGIERVRELIRHVQPTGAVLLLRARDPAGHCIATGVFPALNQAMYFWGGASWREYQSLRPNEAIQWYAMKHWKKRGIRLYDMGGGGEYKRKYGGAEITVPWFRKSKSVYISHMRNFAQKVFRTRQEILGMWTRRPRNTNVSAPHP
jgi:hypothetical protein